MLSQEFLKTTNLDISQLALGNEVREEQFRRATEDVVEQPL